jgi:hypothetical protein
MHDDKTIAKIVIEKSRRPAYVEIKDAAFYVRSLNNTTPLNTKQAHNYITVVACIVDANNSWSGRCRLIRLRQISFQDDLEKYFPGHLC